MKKLKTTDTGGFPFVLDDLRWMQDGTNEMLSSFLQPIIDGLGYADKIIILSGCNYSNPAPSTLEITEGYLFWDGEIFYVPANSITHGDPDEVYFSVIESYDVAGDKITQTSVAIQTYQIRTVQMTISAVALPSGIVREIHEVQRYTELLLKLLKTKVTPWIRFADYNNDFFYGAGQTPTDQFRKFMIDFDGFVHLKGHYFIDDAGEIEITACNLPAGFRPPNELYYKFMLEESPVRQIVVKIKTNGNITLQTTADVQNGLWLHQIPPFRVV